MSDSIGKRLAEELKRRAETRARLQQEANRKNEEQEASDHVALDSLARRIREEVDNFNENAGDLPHLAFCAQDGSLPYTLTGTKTVSFFIEASKLQITVSHSSSPLLSKLVHDAKGYSYHHIGLNGMATHRESTEDEIVDDLLKQACGL